MVLTARIHYQGIYIKVLSFLFFKQTPQIHVVLESFRRSLFRDRQIENLKTEVP